MSNIPECLVAHHCGIQVLSFSLITNMCSVDYGCELQEPNAEVNFPVITIGGL